MKIYYATVGCYKLSVAAFLAFALMQSTVCSAQVIHHHPGATKLPSNLKFNSQYYDTSASGMSELLSTYKNTDPKLYSLLEPDLKKIKTKRNIKWIVTGVGACFVGTGMALMIGGSNSDSSSEEIKRNTNLSIGMFSLGVIAVGSTFFIGPKRKDYFNFINKHNRLNPNQKIELQLGLAPDVINKNGMLVASFVF